MRALVLTLSLCLPSGGRLLIVLVVRISPPTKLVQTSSANAQLGALELLIAAWRARNPSWFDSNVMVVSLTLAER